MVQGRKSNATVLLHELPRSIACSALRVYSILRSRPSRSSTG